MEKVILLIVPVHLKSFAKLFIFVCGREKCWENYFSGGLLSYSR